MNITGKILKACLILGIAFTTLDATVENSVISTIEQFESIDQLPTKKFTKRQFQQITDALAKQDDRIRLVSYNMLFNLYDHNLDEENRWPNRLPRIVELVDAIQPDIICTQELYPDQFKEISKELHDYSAIEGCEDEDTEFYAIFYRKDRFELMTSNIEYPLSMVQLKDLKTNQTFAVFNTHMPFSNPEKREANARFIADKLETSAQEMSTLFAGDLNTFTNRLELTLPFYDGDYIHRILSKGAMKDSVNCSLLGHFGPISTFTNDPNDSSTPVKPFKGTGTPGIILDYIYVCDRITVLTHATEPATVNGHYPSDHMPVLIDFIIQ